MTRHIATSSNVGLIVRRGMRVPVCFISDGWLMGPCVRDLQAQMRLRVEFWACRGPDRTRFLVPYRRTLHALDADEPIVLWTSPAWQDRVAFWALCSYRLQQRPTQPDISHVAVGEHKEQNPPVSFGIGYVTLKPAMSRRSWETVRPLSLSEVREKAQFWKRLAAPSPILSGKPLRETEARKELFELGDYQAGHFPRQTERGLFLSNLDRLMLDLVNETPRSPAGIFMRAGEKGKAFREWFALIGDVFLFERLAQWAKHGVSPALHAVPHTTPYGVQTALYTITDTGRAILRDGLPSIDQAPPLPIWGVTAYDPKNPWVVVEEAEGRPVLRLLGE